MPTRIASFVLPPLVLLSLAGCREPGTGGSGVEAGPTVLGPESVYRVERQPIQTGPRIAGSLEAERQAVIRSEVAGSVTGVEVELGEPVAPGQVLARIEDRALREALASSRSAVRSMEQEATLAQRQLERARKLAAAGGLSERDLELAQSAAVGASARLDEARARLAASQKQVDAATVRAPFAGAISERSVNEGDVVAPGAPLFSVIDPSSMRLLASVPSDRLGALAAGRPVRFEVRGYPGQTFEGKIERIAPAVDPATRQITVLVSIPNPGNRLIAGLFAEGEVTAERREALVVPLSAVDASGSTPYVLRVRGGEVERVDVATGLTDERTERVEIRSGLEAGDLVLIGPARTVAPGTKVQL